MEITQPMCYAAGSGRLELERDPALKKACEDVIQTLSQEGKIQPEIRDLLQRALEKPADFIRFE